MSVYRVPGERPPTPEIIVPEEKPPRPPTVIKYRTYALVARGWAITTLLAFLGVFVFAFFHATHLVCTRSSGQDGVCVASSYGIAVSKRKLEVPLADIVEFVVTKRHRAKGPPTARVELRTTSGLIELSGGEPLQDFQYSNALEAQSQFVRFQSDPKVPKLDLWLHDGVLGSVLMACFAAGFLALAAAFATEQIRQLRWIRIVVDHERGVLEIGGHKVHVDDVKDVRLELGQALTFASGKGEHIVGRRIVVETRGGLSIAATKDFRAGDPAAHRRAIATLRAELRPRLEAAAQAKVNAKRLKRKKKRKRR